MTPEELAQAVRAAVVPGFRDALLAKGQARSLIWRDGVLPAGAPNFPGGLTYDLLSYAYSLLRMAIRLRESQGDEGEIRRAFEQAGNALEAVIKNCDPHDPAQGFHRILAAAAFHLGRYSARAFSLLNVSLASQNLTPCERALANFILRSFDQLERDIYAYRAGGPAADDALESMLQRNVAIDAGDSLLDSCFDALDLVLTENFLGALGAFILALETGAEDLVLISRKRLQQGLESATAFNLVPQWWCHRLTLHMLDDLWSASFHQVIPSGRGGDGVWNELRALFIATLIKRRRVEIELWPSQLEAARRAVDPGDDLVVALPTSAGKTRIAELCILHCLSQGKRAVYVTPLRALSAQVEVSLQRTFAPLGKSVSALYGSIGKSHYDDDVLQARDIVVATPEKLDFALRNDPSLLDDVGVVVLDEGHMIGLGEREVRYEVQVQRLLRRADADTRRIVCLSAVLPDGDQLNDFVSWLRRDKSGDAVRSLWRPTGLRFGEVVWAKDRARLNLRIGDEQPFVPAFISGVVPPIGKRRKVFPKDQNELVLATAWRLVDENQTVLVYCPQKRSVEPAAERIVDLNKRGALPSVLKADPALLSTALAIGTEWLGANHPILKCLKLGVAIHHGALPTPFRKELERLLREGVLSITVSSPTLAQGLNLAATAIVFSSLHRSGEIIPTYEFKNVVGRAGRAFIDSEGLVLFPIYDNQRKRRGQWEDLIGDAKARSMESGLLLLVNALLVRLHKCSANRRFRS
jgi:superfamily II DNA/RNA helicase